MPSSSVGIHKGVRVMRIPAIIAEFTDKEGVKQTKIAFIIGNDVRFVHDDMLSGPVAPWLSESVLIAAGVKD